MWKNAAGAWEHDWRGAGMPRYRCSYGMVSKTEANRLHAAMAAVYRARLREIVLACKARRVTVDQIAELRDAGRPLLDALAVAVPAVEPWPCVGRATELYVEALEQNQNRARGTAKAVASQLQRWLQFEDYDTPLDAVTTARVMDFQAALVAEGYKPNTVTSTVWRVGSLYQWFIRRERIEAREAKRAPRVLHAPLDPETVSRARTSRARFLSVEEAGRLIAATPRPLLFPVTCGLFAGFRIGEMIHLRPSFDVDLTLGTLAVQRQPTWTPKTAHSIRHVPISAALRPILEQHLERYASEEWVTPSFGDPSRPLNDATFEKHLKRIVLDAELIPGQKDPMGITYHTLRHTFASWLLTRGADLYTVAQLLGNTAKQVEMTYGHLAKDHRQRAVDRLADAVNPKLLNLQEIAASTATSEPPCD